jgi:hypothetical protein
MNERNYGLRPDNRRAYEPPPLRPSVVLRVAAVLFGGILFAALIASAFAVAYLLHAVLAP